MFDITCVCVWVCWVSVNICKTFNQIIVTWSLFGGDVSLISLTFILHFSRSSSLLCVCVARTAVGLLNFYRIPTDRHLILYVCVCIIKNILKSGLVSVFLSLYLCIYVASWLVVSRSRLHVHVVYGWVLRFFSCSSCLPADYAALFGVYVCMSECLWLILLVLMNLLHCTGFGCGFTSVCL